MADNPLHDTLAAVRAKTGLELDAARAESVAGGDINAAFEIPASDGERYFLKLNEPLKADMFAAERAGLAALKEANQVRVPSSVASGATEQHAWLLLEWLDLTHGNDNAARHLGTALANLHQVRAERFGFDHDNTIGRTPQINTWCDNWADFYRDYRLQPQLERAVDNGLSKAAQTGVETIQQRLGDWFENYQPKPSLLHGDLWGGNWGMLTNGQPVIFDPAVYYGDRETDLAMTRLFGGFPEAFYVAYNGVWPLDANAAQRAPLYDLYHLLNHFNLFGSSYLAQTDRIITQLLEQ